MKISRIILPLALLSTPLLALAQTGINTSYLTPYSTGIIGVVNNILVPVLMAIALVVFLWGVYKYFILGAADEKSRTDGRQFTLWGIIGFIVIVSLWGIVNLIMGTFGLQAGVAAPPPPTFGTGSYSATGAGGGAGSGYTGGTLTAAQSNANAVYTSCVQGGGSAANCQAAYTTAGGTGVTVGGTQYDANGVPICVPPKVIDYSGGGCGDPTPTGGDTVTPSEYTICINGGYTWVNGACVTGSDSCYDADGNYICEG